MSIKVIKVLSRRNVLREAQRDKQVFSTWAVISVNAYAGAFTDANDDGSEKSPFDVAEIPTRCRINLNFDDISAEDGIAGFKAFDSQMATEIKNFVDTVYAEGAEKILVHCHAGLSRSPAIAICIADYLYANNLMSTIDYRISLQNLRARAPSPNPHVMATLRRVLYPM